MTLYILNVDSYIYMGNVSNNIRATLSFQVRAAGLMVRGVTGTTSVWPALKSPTAASAASRAWRTSAPHEPRQVPYTPTVIIIKEN